MRVVKFCSFRRLNVRYFSCNSRQIVLQYNHHFPVTLINDVNPKIYYFTMPLKRKVNVAKQTKEQPAEEAVSKRARKNEAKEELIQVDSTSDSKGQEKLRGRGRKPAKTDEPTAISSTEREGDKKTEPKGRGRARKTVDEAELPEDEQIENEAEENGNSKSKPKGKGRSRKVIKNTEDEAEVEVAKDDEPTGKDNEDVNDKPKGKGRAKRGANVKAKNEDEPKEKVPQKENVEKNGDQTKSESKVKGTRGKRTATSEEPQKKLKNPTETAYGSVDFSSEKKNGFGKLPNLRIASWNVDGIRAWAEKGGVKYLDHEKPDIFCIQETKCNQDQLPNEVTGLEQYKQHWISSAKKGYAGAGILSCESPLNVQYGINDGEQDEDGRCITAEFEKFYIVSVYVPNAGNKLVTLPKRLLWNTSFKAYIKELDEKKPVIICGDMNVAHNEIDLANPKTNTKNAGFTVEEREGMTDFLSEGFIDTFRKFYPDKKDAYSFWSYRMNARAKNTGWRLDYFLVSERLADNLCDSVIRNDILGSDHCPVTLLLNI